MRVWQFLGVLGATIGIALLAINAILTFQVLQTLQASPTAPTEVAVDWQIQRQVTVDIADISLNEDMYSDVPTGFLPVMSAWQINDDGKPVHLGLDVVVKNSELGVWVQNPELDVYVGSGSITVDNPSDFWP